MEIITLGTSHGAAEIGRQCSATLFKLGGVDNKDCYLFDAGANVESSLTDMGIPCSNVNAIFITHMHVDHLAGLTSLLKRFTTYEAGRQHDIFLPEQAGIDGIITWCKAMHFGNLPENIRFHIIKEGNFFDDGKMKVSAIKTEHIVGFPTYAFLIETNGKAILYTGDLAADIHDYPKIAYERDFDMIVCELTHFKLERDIDVITKSRTKRLIFNHVYPTHCTLYKKLKDKFPFTTYIAEDGDRFEM